MTRSCYQHNTLELRQGNGGQGDQVLHLHMHSVLKESELRKINGQFLCFVIIPPINGTDCSQWGQRRHSLREQRMPVLSAAYLPPWPNPKGLLQLCRGLLKNTPWVQSEAGNFGLAGKFWAAGRHGDPRVGTRPDAGLNRVPNNRTTKIPRPAQIRPMLPGGGEEKEN